MPKIFILRHQLAEQQARLKQQAKSGTLDLSVANKANNAAASNASSSSSDEDAGPQNLSVYPHAQQQRQQQQPLDLGRPQQTQGKDETSKNKCANVLFLNVELTAIIARMAA